MKIITISRELGKRLADLTGFDYYDSEIISKLSDKSGMNRDYIEKTLNDHGWRDVPITFRTTLGSTGYVRASKVNLLVQQKTVIEEIAALGRDCIIVGRNADVLLREYAPFNLFVCAETHAKITRCMERSPEGEHMTEKELVRKMKAIDKMRAQTREIIGGPAWGQRDAYHLTVNTTGWSIKELVPAVADFAMRWFGRET